jgi:hypothetical protein
MSHVVSEPSLPCLALPAEPGPVTSAVDNEKLDAKNSEDSRSEDAHDVDTCELDEWSDPARHPYDFKVPSGYQTLILGVHRVILARSPQIVSLPGSALLSNARGVLSGFPALRWFLAEIYGVDGRSTTMFVVVLVMMALKRTAFNVITDRMLSLVRRAVYHSFLCPLISSSD